MKKRQRSYITVCLIASTMLLTASVVSFGFAPFLAVSNPTSPIDTGDKTSTDDQDKANRTYAIAKGRTSNGDISFSSDEAKPGDTFTVCITPSTGYSVATYLVDGVEHNINDAQKGQSYYIYDLVQKEGGTTIGATFVANTYTISFLDMEKGRTFDPITVTYDQAITLPSKHSDVFGYNVGWHDSDYVTYSSGQTWMVASDVTLYSKWYYDTYKIILDPDGGKFVDSSTAAKTQTVGYEQSWEFAEPTRDGYTFSGWYLGEELVPSKGTTWTQYTEDKVLKAKWTGNSYRVSYDVNGGGLDDSSDTEVTYGESYTLKTPTRKGYSFGGWYYEGKAVTSSTWNITSSVTLVAQWTANEYTIGLNAAGGTISKATAKVKYGSSWSLETPKKDGYDFLGWYDGETRFESTGTDWSIDGDVELKAKWDAQKYTISFDTDGGSSKESVEVTYNAQYDLGANPTKEGASFSGWVILDTSKKVESFGDHWTSSTSSVTLKATWTNAGVTVYLNPNGGTLGGSTSTRTQTVIYGESYSFAEPTKTGYKFNGWHTAASGGVLVDSSGTSWTHSESTTNLYAQWTAEQYTVTLNPDGGTLDGLTDIVEKKVTYDSSWDFGTPRYDGYEFAGWYDGNTKVESSGDAWQHSSSNVSLTAKWTPNAISITLDPNNGNLTGASSLSIEYNGKWSISDPARAGHTFAGWKTESGTPVSSKGDHWTYTTESVKLIAQWTADDVKVSFDARENGTLDNGTYTTIKYEGEWDFSSYAPTASKGYAFEGWYSDTALTKGVSATGTSWTLAEGSITLYAKYTENDVSVELSPGADDATLTDGSTMPSKYNGSYSFERPTRDGYTFSGWQLKDGTPVNESGSWTYSYDSTAVTVTAQWTANDINVILDAGEGKVIGTSKYSFKYDGAYEITSVAERDDFAFGGWYIDDEEKTIETKGESWTYSKGGEVTLHAKWIGNNYTITLDPKGGSLTETSIIVQKGSSYELPTPTTTDSYRTFDGWYDSSDKKWEAKGTYDVSGNTTLTAKWTFDFSSLTVGDSINFGQYPQSKVSDEVLNTSLDSLISDDGWTSYEYYVSSVKSDIMYWQDVTYNGDRYRGVRILAQRPSITSGESANGSGFQYKNGYVASSTEIYWFKYESIKWRFNSASLFNFMPNIVLDAQHYYYQGENGVQRTRTPYDSTTEASVYDNNYQYSDIRGWLNTSFYNWAFDDTEKSVIQNTIVYHGANTVYNTSESPNSYYSDVPTYENVYLLSYNVTFVGNTYYADDDARKTTATDYAVCQGVYVDLSGYTRYWTRSPYTSSRFSSVVQTDGTTYAYNVKNIIGIKPVIKLVK